MHLKSVHLPGKLTNWLMERPRIAASLVFVIILTLITIIIWQRYDSLRLTVNPDILALKPHFYLRSLLPLAIIGIVLAMLAGLFIFYLAKRPHQLEILVKRNAQKIVEQNNRNEAIVNALSDRIFLLDAQGNITSDFEKEKMSRQNNGHSIENNGLCHFFDPVISRQMVEIISEVLAKGQNITQSVVVSEPDPHFYEATFSYCNENEVLLLLRDVTQRVNIELAVKESEKSLLQILRSTMDLFYVVDKDFNIRLINEVAARTLELAWGARIQAGTNLLDVIPKGSSERILHSLQKAFNGQDTEYEWEGEIEGLQQWLLVRYVPVKDSEKQITGVTINIKDISVKKIAEQKLVHSNYRFELIARTTNDAVWEWNIETGTLWGNATHQYLYGLTINDQVPAEHDWVARIHPKDRERVVENQREVLASQGNIIISEYLFNTAHDGYRYIYDRCYVLRNNEGKPMMLTGSMMDITGRKNAELQMIQSEEKYRTLVEQAIDAIALFDEKGAIKDVNAGGLKLLGYRKEELLKMNICDLLIDSDLLDNSIRYDVLKTGESTVKERRMKTKEGKIIETEVRTQQLPDGLFLSVVRDMTERNKNEEELRESYLAIRRLTAHLQDVREEERTHIAREIHDELGQQLTVLKMDISWLNRKLAEEDEQIKIRLKDLLMMIDTIVKSVRRISAELRPSILDDLGLIAAIEWHLKEFQKHSGIMTHFIVEEDEIQLDANLKTALYRVCQECMTNVARHSKAKQVYVRLNQDKELIHLQIEDDGVGFDVTSIAEKRTLGLLGMYERTAMIQGGFDIQSTPGKGTKISITVPVHHLSGTLI